MNLVFLGPPGSGKGTQALRLSAKLDLSHLSTGDVLREAVKAGSELGKQAEGHMKRGELVPDELMVALIRSKIAGGDLSQGFILDGFPRTMSQAESLKKMFGENNIGLDKAILLDVSDDEIIRRLSGRWFCPKCNAGYNYPANMPKTDGKCDNDGETLSRRPDDEETVVKNRLDVYRRQTEPIVGFYQKESILTEIAAEGTPDEIFEAMLKAVS